MKRETRNNPEKAKPKEEGAGAQRPPRRRRRRPAEGRLTPVREAAAAAGRAESMAT